MTSKNIKRLIPAKNNAWLIKNSVNTQPVAISPEGLFLLLNVSCPRLTINGNVTNGNINIVDFEKLKSDSPVQRPKKKKKISKSMITQAKMEYIKLFLLKYDNSMLEK